MKLIQNIIKQFALVSDTVTIQESKLKCVSPSLKEEKEDNVYYLIFDDKLYNVIETASLLRCKPNTVYTWKYQKKLTPNKSGGKLLFKGKEIKRFLGIEGV